MYQYVGGKWKAKSLTFKNLKAYMYMHVWLWMLCVCVCACVCVCVLCVCVYVRVYVGVKLCTFDLRPISGNVEDYCSHNVLQTTSRCLLSSHQTTRWIIFSQVANLNLLLLNHLLLSAAVFTSTTASPSRLCRHYFRPCLF